MAFPFHREMGKALEEVPSAVRGRDAQALNLEAADAFDGVDG